MSNVLCLIHRRMALQSAFGASIRAVALLVLAVPALALILPGRAAAAWPDPNVNLVVSALPNTERNLSACTDGSGGAYVAWHGVTSNGYSHLYVSRVLASGDVAPGFPVGIDYTDYPYDDTYYYGFFAELVPDGSGGVDVVWQFRRTNNCGGPDQRTTTKACRIAPTGGSFYNKIDIQEIGQCSVTGDMASPSVIPDGSGGVKMAWTFGSSWWGGSYPVYYAHYQANGSVTGPLTVLTTTQPWRAVIADDGLGGSIVAWCDDRSGAEAKDVFATRVRPDDTLDPDWTAQYPAGVPICAATGAVDPLTLSAVSDLAGGAILVWQDGRGQYPTVYAQRLRADRTVAWFLNGIDLSNNYRSERPVAVSDGIGGFYVVWEKKDDDWAITSHVHCKHITAAGTPAAGQWLSYGLAVDGPSNAQRIVADGAGGAFVVYCHSSSGEIRAQHVLTDRLDPGGHVVVCSAPGNHSEPEIACDAPDQAVAFWRDYRNDPGTGWPTGADIYAQGNLRPNTHRIQASAGLGGLIEPSGVVDVIDGGSQTFTMTANPQYGIRRVLVDGNSVGTPATYTFTNVTADHTISASFMASEVGAVAPASCVATVTPCVTVPVDITRADFTSLRGFSVSLQLTSNLMLCNGLESITEGTYLSGIGATHFERTDNGSGSYTVDCVILGQPCGATAPSGNLFNLAVKAAGTDGTGSVTITGIHLRDCANAPIASAISSDASVTIDMTPPAAITNLTASTVVAGHDADGTLGVGLTFSPPQDAETVEVYRAPYGAGGSSAYPEYDDVAGAGLPAAPSYPPGSPWTSTTVTASGGVDEVATRGFWSYVVFTKDACGNVSAVSNRTAGILNYRLGDYAPPPGGGNNVVDGLDVSALGAHYGVSLAFNDPNNYLDIGPTSDGSPQALPMTDDRVDFEDMMILGINFDPAGFQRQGPVSMQPASVIGIDATRPPALTLVLDPILRPGDPLVGHLRLVNNVGQVKGIHALVSFDASAYELAGVDAGGLLSDGEVFWTTLADARGTWVDAVSLGEGRTFSGSGEVARLRFRQRGPGASPALAAADLRDGNNRAPSVGSARNDAGADRVVETKPTITGDLDLAPIAHPNPFTGRTEISFRLPAEGPADLRIYDVAGRLVRTLTSGSLAAGDHALAWDGRSESGAPAGRGVYFYELRTAAESYRRKLLLIQ